MAETLILPLDVLDLIFQNLVRSPKTLMNCSLVRKQWLSPSRRYLQSFKQIGLDILSTTERVQVLKDMLLNSEPECSFWPHISKLSINSGYTTEPCEMSIRLLLKSLSLASTLRTLVLYYVKFPILPRDTFPNNNTISSLRIKGAQFTSPVQLLDFLASLRNLHSELKLEDISFANADWDFDEPNFVPHPSLRVYLELEELKDILPLILRYKWNVTSLTMNSPKSVGVDLYNQLLQHIGPSLEKMSMSTDDPWESDDEDEEDEGENDEEEEEGNEEEDEENQKIVQRRNELGVISLEHNTALREISVGRLVALDSSNERRPYMQLASILATITSREKFERLRCTVEYYGDYEEEEALIEYIESDDNEEKYRFVESFNWKVLDDALGDTERFPGNGPTFKIGLGRALDNFTVTEVLLPKCMPKLAKRGNIETHYF